MSLSALRSLGDAIEATRLFLLPASVRRLGVLAVIIAFIGSAGTPLPASPSAFDPMIWTDPADPTTVPPAFDLPQVDVTPPPIEAIPSWVYLVIAVAVVLGLLVAFIGVLMRFVLVKSLSNGTVRLRHPAKQYFSHTLSVFGFRIGLGVVGIIVSAAGIVLATDLLLTGPGIAGTAIIGILVVTVLTLLWIVDAVTLQFVVPVMVGQDVGVLTGWGQLWPTLVSEWLEYVLYGVARLILGVVIGLAFALLLIVALVVLGIPVITGAAIVVVVAGGIGQIGTIGWLVIGGLVAVFVVGAIIAGLLINVPFQVYLWYYALFVLGDTNSDFDIVKLYRHRVRAGESTPL